MIPPDTTRYFNRMTMKKLLLSLVLVALLAPSAAMAVTELVWYQVGQGQWPYPDAEQVYARLNDMLEKDLGMKVTFVMPGGFGEYKTKAPLMMAAGEYFDLIFTSHWCNSYYDAVEKELYEPLDDLLAKHAPTISAELKDYFNALRVNGKVYGVWNMHVAVKNSMAKVWKKHAEKYGWNPGQVQSLKDLEPLLAAIKANEPDLIPLGTRKPPAMWAKYSLGYTGIGLLEEQGLAVKIDDPTLKIVLLLEQPEYVANIKLSREWYQKGYIAKDGMTIAPDQWQKLWNSGKIAIDMHNSPDLPLRDKLEAFGELTQTYTFGEPFVEGPSITANITAISSQSKHKAEAIKLLEYLWTHPDAYNLLVYGIEGKHYQKLEDGRIKLDPSSGYYTGPAPYLYGNTFNAYVVEPAPVNTNEAGKTINTTAKKTMSMGFTPNLDEVKTLAAAVSAVTAQYDLPVQIGYVDPDTELPKYLAALKKAGVDELISKLQAQIDAWLASKK